MKTIKGFAREKLRELKKRKKQVYLKIYMPSEMMDILEEISKETEMTKSGFMRLLLISFIKFNTDIEKLAHNSLYEDIDLSDCYGTKNQLGE